MWILFAVGAAAFAALTAIFAKIGVREINANLATAVRTLVALVLACGIVFATRAHRGVPLIAPRTWLFLVLSGLATGASWLCYFKALQMAPVSKVAPVDKLSVPLVILLAFLFLHETVSWQVLTGGILILLGSLLMCL